ncbi:DUF1552 domain-containing protein [Verrucomicrobiaceae bacterium 5K15]|uniref:DUF1552 domain-containing protein n=1 Tax=Oceaniferula flava TaxID=2800421 RepID=A0AAE2SCI2_9BACT|nr:DUF1552 domain-containing protein [Oceaniferula flavus]MBK1855918.1 DUF1552 domain-containing protein [Oceaniferula flavus]MBM1137225.1 DUF1552 domain-containing protein [Oceaniferula flavus]
MQRRTFLKGLGATLAIPQLESLHAAQAASAPAAPLRMAFVYAPNGVNLKKWMPSGVGSGYQMAESMKPMEKLRDSFQIIGGLDHDKAKSNGDGAGDHARANATYLTGCQARKTAGDDIHVGTSVDQIAAQQIGHQTRLPSLELSTDPPRKSGRCDSGYSCAYQYNLSWRSASTPMPAERNPRAVFEKLFGTGNAVADAKRRARQQSVLDFVLEDAKRMRKKAGFEDRDKLEEYMTAVRDVEQRISRHENFEVPTTDFQSPSGIPASYREHIRLMYQLMTLAFRTDSTRISTFLLAHDGSNRSFNEIGISGGHHSISHHKGNEENLEQIAQIDQFYLEEYARFIAGLKSMQEGNGTMLDNTMIVYGSGIGDGNRHNHNDLPLILAGGGGGSLNPGRYHRVKEGTPMTNLYLAMLERMNVNARRVGDSSGVLQGI